MSRVSAMTAGEVGAQRKCTLVNSPSVCHDELCPIEPVPPDALCAVL